VVALKSIARVVFLFALLCSFAAQAANTQVEFRTSLGTYVVELYPDKAPRTVANFLEYVNSGFYEGTIFHRVIEGFVAQGGGLMPDLHQKKTLEPIPNEANNGLKNEYGTLAMARLFNADSATAQFFINVAENKTLNFTRSDSAHMGYCVFGRVVRGMDVVEKITHLPTQTINKLPDVPTQVVMIEKAVMLEAPVLAENTVQSLPENNTIKSSTSVKKGKKKRG
jgi:peptidyl-prolyl cis-trans isomerase A (cyclophilin A)